MAHGVEAVPPLDIVEAIYLLPPLNVPTSTEDLIAHHAQQLQKTLEDIHDMSARVLNGQEAISCPVCQVLLFHSEL